MIQRFSNYKPQDMNGSSEKLPAGAYVARICQASIENNQWGERLVLLVDVTEGQYTGFYHKLYEANKNSRFDSARKYKGVYRIGIPKDGVDDSMSSDLFNALIYRVHQSNPGYDWDKAGWDERTLVNKYIGILVREAEWGEHDEEGHPIVKGVFTEIGGTCTVDEVRHGTAMSMKRRVLKDKTNSGSATFEPAPANNGFTAVETNDLPF